MQVSIFVWRLFVRSRTRAASYFARLLVVRFLLLLSCMRRLPALCVYVTFFTYVPVTSIRQRRDDQPGNVTQVLHAIPDIRGHHADNNYFRFLCARI